MKPGKDFWITLALAFLLTFALQSLFFSPNQNKEEVIPNIPLLVQTTKDEFHITENVILTLKPGSGSTLPVVLQTDCPNEPFEVYKNNLPVTATTSLGCEDFPANLEIPVEGMTISYGKWNKELFSEPGSYEIRVPYGETTYNVHFKMVGDNFIGHMWNQLFNRPIYNLLVGLTSVLGHSLGWAIIVLTILIKLILFVPTQHAMESQRKMQLIQPKLKEIQKKYKDNKQMQSLETMRILKENHVNPMGSCLPILIQIPVLIALFYAVQNGLSLSYSINLYPFLSHLDITKIDPLFLGLMDLSKANIWIVPVVVGTLQFVQMKLALPKPNPEKTSAKEKVIEQKPDGTNIFAEAMPDMNQMSVMMLYVMPAMIALMSATFPAGVGLYWAMQSLLGIAQQQYVNKMKVKLS